MESWLILGPGQEKFKRSLECLVPESKEVLKKKKDGSASKKHKTDWKELRMAKTGII